MLTQHGILSGEANLSDTQVAEGAVSEIRSAVMDGNTVYFIRLIGSDLYYSVSAVDNPQAVILNEGDQVSITYRPAEGSILSGMSLEIR